MHMKTGINIKIFYKVLLLLFFFVTFNVYTQQAPFLLKPSNNAKNVRTEKLVLEWIMIQEAESYQLQVARDPLFEPNTIVVDVQKITESATISELMNSTSYWWRVRVNAENMPWSDVWKFTTTGLPKPVLLLKPEDGKDNLNPDVLVFEWSEDSVNASFNFQLSFDPEFSDTLRNNMINDESIELTNLLSGYQYYWRIKPFNIDGFPGQWSDVSGFRTELRKANLVFPSNFSNNQDTSITFRWSAVNLASIYDFQLGLDEKFSDTVIIVDTSTTFRQIKIGALANDSVYYWRVKSRNAFGDTSRWSEPYTFKTKLKSPQLLSPANFSRNLDTHVKLEWTEQKEFDTYRVQIASDSTFRNVFTDSYVEYGSATILNLDYNKFYYWRVNLRNSVGDTSYWTDYFKFKTKLRKPVLDEPLDNTALLAENIAFRWHPVDSAESYILQISESNDYSSLSLSESTEDTSVIIDQLEINRYYFWRIKAENSRTDTSEWSESFSLRTSRFSISSLEIDTTINFSKMPVDTISSFIVNNYSDNEIVINSILAFPDTLFSVTQSSPRIAPNLSQEVFVVADTSRLLPGLSEGRIAIVSEAQDSDDTLWISMNLFSQMAIGGFSLDSLAFDTTNASNPRTQNFKVNNRRGNITLQVKRIYVDGEDAGAFELIGEVDKIGAGDSVNLQIRFKPVRLNLNKAKIIIESNSYNKPALTLPISGIGKGGKFSENTLTSLEELKEDTFKSIAGSSRELLIRNDGNLPLEFKVSFSQNYFQLLNTAGNSFTIQPGDTGFIDLHYMTPNFEIVNIDTLKIDHNGVGNSPLKYILKGSFDSTLVVSIIKNSIQITGQNVSDLSGGFQVPVNSSIESRLTGNLFENESNLIFRLNYFTGGPGSKKEAINNNTRFIIPYQNVTDKGLILTGELFTRGSGQQPIDSIKVFDFIDVQVTANNFTSANFNVPITSPAENAATANTNWVLFGYPFANIISDSVFNDLGQMDKMEDGQWIVYEYNEISENGFDRFSGNFLEPMKAYFIAQSITESFKLSYTYDNTILTRKLSDNKIVLHPGQWNAISNPYTFDVEIDTPAVLYRYDTEAGSYKLTNIMRPGEGYFVQPNVSELNLITFGDYYPVLFPKTVSEAEWFLELTAANDKKSEDIYLIKYPYTKPMKQSFESLLYKKAPKIKKGFEISFITTDDNKYSAALAGPQFNTTYYINLESEFSEKVSMRLKESGVLPPGVSYILYEPANGMISDNDNLFISANEPMSIKLLVGTDSFIANQLNSMSNENSFDYKLGQNYPNPFNPTTSIKFSIAAAGLTKIIVYDILGREVALLLNEQLEPGSYSITFDATSVGRKLSSGVYLYTIEINNFKSGRKMILMK